ncbi:DUF4376 domain-containing protein [bacterium]|nr:DUF4376 domain-containing protein [bacterium]
MIKKYTDKDYADKAVEANREGKRLYIWVHEEEREIQVPDYDEDGNIIGYHTEIIKEEVAELLIAEPNYYICYAANYTDGTINPDFDTDRINALRNQLNDENTKSAKMAVEKGYVEFKDAQFETNAQTVGDLTATMLLMQATGMETYSWLSKDDKVVELTLEDFGTLGGLIAGFKAHIWNEEYLSYKEQIAEAQTYEELKEIVIEY